MQATQITTEEARRFTQLLLAAILAVIAMYNAGYFVGGLLAAPAAFAEGMLPLSLAVILGVAAQQLFVAGMARDTAK